MDGLFFYGEPGKKKNCSYKTTNILGRDICRIFGKRKCDNCEYRNIPITFWMVRHPRVGTVILQEKPIKSSLGYLLGYPTIVTQEEPIKMKLARQGTTSMKYPRKF